MFDEISTRYVIINPTRWINTYHLLQIICRGSNQIQRNDSLFYDLLVVVNVPDEVIERLTALQHATFNGFPFVMINDPWKEVKRKDLFFSLLISIHLKSNALIEKRGFGFVIQLCEILTGVTAV